MGSTMHYDEIDRVGDIKVGDIIKWVDDKWLDDPKVDSKAKIWLCVGVKSGKGFWFYRINTKPNRGFRKKFSIRLSRGDYNRFLSHDSHIDCYRPLNRAESEVNSRFEDRNLVRTAIRKSDIQKILDLFDKNPDDFIKDQVDPIRKQLMSAADMDT